MYIIVAGRKNGDDDYFGPFKTKARANKYSETLRKGNWNRWFIKPLVCPHCIKATLEETP